MESIFPDGDDRVSRQEPEEQYQGPSGHSARPQKDDRNQNINQDEPAPPKQKKTPALIRAEKAHAEQNQKNAPLKTYPANEPPLHRTNQTEPYRNAQKDSRGQQTNREEPHDTRAPRTDRKKITEQRSEHQKNQRSERQRRAANESDRYKQLNETTRQEAPVFQFGAPTGQAQQTQNPQQHEPLQKPTQTHKDTPHKAHNSTRQTPSPFSPPQTQQHPTKPRNQKLQGSNTHQNQPQNHNHTQQHQQHTPALATGTGLRNGAANLIGNCKNMEEYDNTLQQADLQGFKAIRIINVPTHQVNDLLISLTTEGDCDGNVWKLPKALNNMISIISPSKNGKIAWVSVFMHKVNYEKLGFIDGVNDLSRTEIIPGVHNLMAYNDTIGSRRGHDYTGLVLLSQPTERNRFGHKAIEDNSQVELWRLFHRINKKIAATFGLDSQRDITIRTRYRPNTKTQITVILMRNIEHVRSAEAQATQMLRDLKGQPITWTLEGNTYKTTDFERAETAESPRQQEREQQYKEINDRERGRKCIIMDLPLTSTPYTLQDSLHRRHLMTEGTINMMVSKFKRDTQIAYVLFTTEDTTYHAIAEATHIRHGGVPLRIKLADPTAQEQPTGEAQERANIREHGIGHLMTHKQQEMLNLQLNHSTGEALQTLIKQFQGTQVKLVQQITSEMTSQISDLEQFIDNKTNNSAADIITHTNELANYQNNEMENITLTLEMTQQSVYNMTEQVISMTAGMVGWTNESQQTTQQTAERLNNIERLLANIVTRIDGAQSQNTTQQKQDAYEGPRTRGEPKEKNQQEEKEVETTAQTACLEQQSKDTQPMMAQDTRMPQDYPVWAFCTEHYDAIAEKLNINSTEEIDRYGINQTDEQLSEMLLELPSLPSLTQLCEEYLDLTPQYSLMKLQDLISAAKHIGIPEHQIPIQSETGDYEGLFQCAKSSEKILQELSKTKNPLAKRADIILRDIQDRYSKQKTMLVRAMTKHPRDTTKDVYLQKAKLEAKVQSKTPKKAKRTTPAKQEEYKTSKWVRKVDPTATTNIWDEADEAAAREMEVDPETDCTQQNTTMMEQTMPQIEAQPVDKSGYKDACVTDEACNTLIREWNRMAKPETKIPSPKKEDELRFSAAIALTNLTVIASVEPKERAGTTHYQMIADAKDGLAFAQIPQPDPIPYNQHEHQTYFDAVNPNRKDNTQQGQDHKSPPNKKRTTTNPTNLAAHSQQGILTFFAPLGNPNNDKQSDGAQVTDLDTQAILQWNIIADSNAVRTDPKEIQENRPRRLEVSECPTQRARTANTARRLTTQWNEFGQLFPPDVTPGPSQQGTIPTLAPTEQGTAANSTNDQNQTSPETTTQHQQPEATPLPPSQPETPTPQHSQQTTPDTTTTTSPQESPQDSEYEDDEERERLLEIQAGYDRGFRNGDTQWTCTEDGEWTPNPVNQEQEEDAQMETPPPEATKRRFDESKLTDHNNLDEEPIDPFNHPVVIESTARIEFYNELLEHAENAIDMEPLPPNDSDGKPWHWKTIIMHGNLAATHLQLLTVEYPEITQATIRDSAFHPLLTTPINQGLSCTLH